MEEHAWKIQESQGKCMEHDILYIVFLSKIFLNPPLLFSHYIQACSARGGEGLKTHTSQTVIVQQPRLPEKWNPPSKGKPDRLKQQSIFRAELWNFGAVRITGCRSPPSTFIAESFQDILTLDVPGVLLWGSQYRCILQRPWRIARHVLLGCGSLVVVVSTLYILR